jgi:hypothetical protein
MYLITFIKRNVLQRCCGKRFLSFSCIQTNSVDNRRILIYSILSIVASILYTVIGSFLLETKSDIIHVCGVLVLCYSHTVSIIKLFTHDELSS